jgi:hypothetical protein
MVPRLAGSLASSVMEKLREAAGGVGAGEALAREGAGVEEALGLCVSCEGEAVAAAEGAKDGGAEPW